MKYGRLMFKEKKLCGLFIETVLGGNKVKTLESIRRMCGRFPDEYLESEGGSVS